MLKHTFWRWSAALAVTLATLAGCATLDEQQRRWIFQPSERSWPGTETAAQGLEDVWIDFVSRESGQQVRLHGLWMPQADIDAPQLLYLHGSRWDVRSSVHRMRRMHALGFSVLAIDYRGFGRSSAALPSETLALEDARAAWQWLAAQRPGARPYLFGHSLGGAVAVHLAAELAEQPSGLIVEGTFTSIRDVFGSMKWGWLPIGPFITQRFDSAERITQVKIPVLVVHGSQDHLIRPELGRALYERAPGPKRFELVEGGSHHNTNALGHQQYRTALRDLFRLPL
jgi:uncharacterized protein